MKQPVTALIDIVALANTRVFVSPDQELQLGRLWQKQTAILVFLRHFACIACRAHAAQVWGERENYEKSGARIVFIGNGQPSWIEIFRADLGIDRGVVLTDPSLASFNAAGFKRGLFSLLNPGSAVNAAKLALEGHRQKPYHPDAGSHWQLGGVLAISPQSKVLYHFASKSLGDLPEEPHLEIIRQDEAAKK